MIKKVIILPDAHIDTKVSKEYKLAKKFVKDFKADEIILLGDFMDVSALSGWDLDKRRNMEGRRFKKEVDVTNKELDYLQAHTKKITYLEGNHENRIERYLDKHPEMEGMIDLELVLGLKYKNITYHTINTLYKLGHLRFTHGLYTNEFHTKKTLQAIGDNIVYGHIHRPQAYMLNMQLQKPIMAYSLGALCNKAPDYMKGRPANWMSGFGVVYYDDRTGNFNLYIINIINNKFIWGGKVYE